MRGLRTALVLMLLAGPVLAVASETRVRLLTPAAGTTLRGGAQAVISWQAEALPANAEEWEAFLSIDGGRHYTARITPHLDIAIRHVTWTLPNITTRDARILFRFGDEAHESEVELPYTFAIEGTLGGMPLWPASSSFDGKGEEARAGDGGVTAWVTGTRSGQGAHLVTARHPEGMGGATLTSTAGDREQAATIQRIRITAPATSPFIPGERSRRRPSQNSPAQPPADVLLTSGRLNI